MSRALELLAACRLEGRKPARVWVTLCDEKQPQFWLWSDFTAFEIYAPAAASTARMDWRPLVGCDVVLIADHRTAALKAIVTRLCELVSSMTVSVAAELPAHPGHLFVRGLGWRAI